MSSDSYEGQAVTEWDSVNSGISEYPGLSVWTKWAFASASFSNVLLNIWEKEKRIKNATIFNINYAANKGGSYSYNSLIDAVGELFNFKLPKPAVPCAFPLRFLFRRFDDVKFPASGQISYNHGLQKATFSVHTLRTDDIREDFANLKYILDAFLPDLLEKAHLDSSSVDYISTTISLDDILALEFSTNLIKSCLKNAERKIEDECTQLYVEQRAYLVSALNLMSIKRYGDATENLIDGIRKNVELFRKSRHNMGHIMDTLDDRYQLLELTRALPEQHRKKIYDFIKDELIKTGLPKGYERLFS